MKKFLLRIFVFVLCFFTIASVSIYLINRKIANGSYFNVASNVNCIILGHSHPECAFNDSLIDNFKNISESGEAYFYTYLKLKAILKNNPQVKTVFVEYTNNQVTAEMDLWTWQTGYLEYRFPKYAAIMQPEDYKFLLHHNAMALIRSLSITVKKNLIFLLRNHHDYIAFNNWGGYLHLDNQMKDQVKDEPGNSRSATTTSMSVSKVNVEYLQKIVQFCKTNKVAIYLVRSPLSTEFTGINNEMEYQKILGEKLSGTPLLDFKDFPLPSNAFADGEHLNYKGAKIFSLYFNRMMDEDLLSQQNKQQFIDSSMLSFGTSNQDEQ